MALAWSYDFGETTVEELSSLKSSDFAKGAAQARDAVVNLIESGVVGDADAYRVVVRTDGAKPSGISLEVRPVPPTPTSPTPLPGVPQSDLTLEAPETITEESTDNE